MASRRILLALTLALVLPACGDDGGGGDASTVHFTPSADIQTKLQTAMLGAKDGQTLSFAPGTYKFTEELSMVGKKKITITGEGTDREAVIWDFSALGTGSPNGFSADQADDLVIQNLTVLDPPGDGLKVIHTTNLTFRNLHIKWSAGSVKTNGAYAIYPVLSKNILVEGCTVEGASDAGIYVGQSEVSIVRNNIVKGNVTGIEIENTDSSEVTNNMSMDNVSGILVFNLPNLPRKTGSNTTVHHNMIINNNHEQFAHGGIVAFVPAGTGMILLAPDGTEVHHNTIMGHLSTGIVVTSCDTVDFLTDGALICADSAYDSYPEGINIHDNTFSGNGAMPQGFFGAFPGRPLQDIIWDGVLDSRKTQTDALKLCIKDNGAATFAELDASRPGVVKSTDITAHACTHPAVVPVTVTWGL